ncbi:transposase [Streptosporangium sp. NBC_01639]|uniref:transposase n=1 Tax=Streptosporangium sp. NBC_01639 TaxID=2975948 RepID=UPI0038661302
MALKDYSDEFRADAVALYESTEGATYKGIAADLGVSRGSLRAWVLRARERSGVPPAPARAAARDPLPVGGGDAAAKRIRELEERSVNWRPASGSWPPNGTSCARRPSISPGRQTGEPLPVR